MKVIAINGSPRKAGNTAQSFAVMAPIFEAAGIEFEILHIGNKPIAGCIACDRCDQLDGKCVLDGDIHNKLCQQVAQADGVLFGAPVYYAGIAGGMKCFMDRFFRTNAKNLAFKPVAGICALRRSGGVETFNQLNNYFSLSRSLVVPTFYWSAFHGAAAGEVQQDLEAMDCAKEIATNMCWMLKMLESSTVEKPTVTQPARTNFIR